MADPCYYCEGSGIVRIQTDVDRWDRAEECTECDGSGKSCRRAGRRYTGYLPHRDPLVALREARGRYLAGRATPPRFASYGDLLTDSRIDYDNARQSAMRKPMEDCRHG